MIKRNLPTLLLALALFLGVQAWQTRDTPALAPTELANWISQQSLDPSEQVIGVYVWAEWCSICKLQEGTMDSLQAQYPMVTIAMQSGDTEQVQKMLRQRGLNWITLADPQGRTSQALGASVVPYFLLMNRDGRILSSTSGWSSPWGLRLRYWISRVTL